MRWTDGTLGPRNTTIDVTVSTPKKPQQNALLIRSSGSRNTFGSQLHPPLTLPLKLHGRLLMRYSTQRQRRPCPQSVIIIATLSLAWPIYLLTLPRHPQHQRQT